jgi:hypothetical protein
MHKLSQKACLTDKICMYVVLPVTEGSQHKRDVDDVLLTDAPMEICPTAWNSKQIERVR